MRSPRCRTGSGQAARRSSTAAAAALDCRLHSAHEAGDHQIFIGEVLEIELLEGHRPLVFHGGKYRLLEQPPAVG